jgi:hypothetical protein
MGRLQVGLKPEREESRSVQTTRTVFVLTNLAVSLLWIRFLIRLIEQWSLMKPDIRYAAGIFMVFFCLLWVTLIRDKKGYLSIAMACGILATVYRIVWVLM